MIYSVVDIGSNTVRLSVYKVEDRIKMLFTKKVTLGLASYIRDGVLTMQGITKASEVLKNFQTVLRNLDLGEPRVFATAPLRNIKNSEQACELILQRTGIDVEVLSGAEEARYGFAGANMEAAIEDAIVVDIGGGSTELVLCDNGQMVKAVSIPVGSLNLIPRKTKSILPDKGEYKRVRKLVEEELDKIEGLRDLHYDTLAGVGGTARAMARLNNEIFDMPPENKDLAAKHVKQIIQYLMEDEARGLEIILRVAPDRVRTVIYGMIILWTISNRFGCSYIHVSRLGVREGYLIKRLLLDSSGNEESHPLDEETFVSGSGFSD